VLLRLPTSRSGSTVPPRMTPKVPARRNSICREPAVAMETAPPPVRPGRPPAGRRSPPSSPASPRDWSGHDLAILLGVKPRNMLTQLGEWARQGFFTRTGFGTYRLNTPSDQTPSTDPPILSFVALPRDGLRHPLTEPACRQVRRLSGSGEGPGTGRGAARLPETGREMATRTRASRCRQPGATLSHGKPPRGAGHARLWRRPGRSQDRHQHSSEQQAVTGGSALT
jgi:hypothetical protein